MSRHALVLPVALMIGLYAACDPGDIGPVDDTTSPPPTSSGTPECIEGEIDCPCIGMELCEDGLECIEGICEDVSAGDSGSGSGSGDDGTGTSGGIDGCVDDDDCDISEICAFETCTPTELFSWEMSVTYFEPGGCTDGWGSAEVFYQYFEDTNLIHESAIEGCPASWVDTWQPYEPLSDFQIDFWELDLLFDDFFTTICWPDELGECGPIPPEVLHNGGFAGFTGDDVAYFELALEPILL